VPAGKQQQQQQHQHQQHQQQQQQQQQQHYQQHHQQQQQQKQQSAQPSKRKQDTAAGGWDSQGPLAKRPDSHQSLPQPLGPPAPLPLPLCPSPGRDPPKGHVRRMMHSMGLVQNPDSPVEAGTPRGENYNRFTGSGAQEVGS